MNGKPLLGWCLEAVSDCQYVDSIVIAAPNEALDRVDAVAAEYARSVEAEVIEGGTSRSLSVRTALEASPEAAYVVVHDAARPLVTSELIDACLGELARLDCDGVIAAAPVTDTLKRAEASGRVLETLKRNEVWAAQTPQAFRVEALERAYNRSTPGEIVDATDDALLVEATGGDVRILKAPAGNIKITTEYDLELAETQLSLRSESRAT